MQVILLLLSLFLIACVLYGIYSGVRAIVCSTTRFTQNSCTSALSMDELEITKKDSDRIPSEPYHGINELKTIFELYQQGALSKNEFEGIKAKIIKIINSYPK